MSEEENVNIYFVVPKGLKSENLCSDDMKMAFQVGILLVLRILLLCSKGVVLLFAHCDKQITCTHVFPELCGT